MNKKMVLFFLFLIILQGNVLFFALDPQKQLTQYIHKKWIKNDGLPNNNISSILQTTDGYLWIGSDKGLGRFDGVKFQLYNKENTPGIADNRISILYEDSNQTLWAGTRGGLIRYKNGKFTSLVKHSNPSSKNNLLYDVIHVIQEDNNGNIWIGYQGQGMSILKDNKPNNSLKISHPDMLANIPVINTIAIDNFNSPILWIGTQKGLFTLKEGQLSKFPIPLKDKSSISPIRSLFCGRDGDVWIGTEKNGVIYLQFQPATGTWDITTYDTHWGLKYDFVNTVFKDWEKNVWIGTEGGGLYRLHNNKITAFTEEDGLSNDSVNCIYEDREGNLWVGTLSGLNLFMNGKFTTYTETEGLLDNMTWTVYEDRQKRLWITTNEGLNCFRDGVFRAFTRKDGLCSDFVSCTWEDLDDALWIGTYDHGLSLYENGKFKSIGTEIGLDTMSIRAILTDSKGDTWIGTYGNGVFKKPYQKDIFFSISNKNGLSSDYIFYIYEDRKGGIWIGTDGGGLNHLVNDTITTYTKANGLSSNTIFAITEDTEINRAETLWLATEDGGLDYFDNGKIYAITTENGLSENSIYQIIDDKNGYFWMGGHTGVSRVLKQNLYDFISGKTSKVSSQLFGRADGIKGDECSGSFQPAGWRASDGKIWFPTSKGIASVDPDHIKLNTIAPPLQIEKIILDGKTTQWTDTLTIGPHVQKIEIHYTALSLSEPRNVQFKYLLEGFETQWNSPRDRKDRIATYMNLSPGEYIFRITACNNDGIWNKEGKSLIITVQHPFWQKWWFILSVIFVFSWISYLVHSGIKQLLKMAEFWRKKNFIAGYRLVEQIGSGGMAVVYKAISGKRTKKEILALKLMKEEFIYDNQYRTRFIEEGKIIDSLDHPHIVKIFARGEYNNTPYIAMELLEGVTLETRTSQKQQNPINQSLEIIQQIAEALAAIHNLNITHRDLKPGNIMLINKENNENFVKLLDFGLAKIHSISRVTETGLVVGTLSYLSPEQLLNSEFSPASDIYALGVIFYELLTGQKPYKGETPLEILQQMFKTDITEPQRLRDSISPQLNSLIMCMLDKEPKKRPNAEHLILILTKLKNNPNNFRHH